MRRAWRKLFATVIMAIVGQLSKLTQWTALLVEVDLDRNVQDMLEEAHANGYHDGFEVGKALGRCPHVDCDAGWAYV